MFSSSFPRFNSDRSDGAVDEASSATRTNGERLDDSDHLDYDYVGEYFLDTGILEADDGGNDRHLTDEFATVWWRRIERVRHGGRSRERFARSIGVAPADLTVREDEYFEVVLDDDWIGRWSSRAAFLADVAAEPTLAEWLPEWESLGERERNKLFASLRAFLKRCPGCDRPLQSVDDATLSCGSEELVATSLTCGGCDATVFNDLSRKHDPGPLE